MSADGVEEFLGLSLVGRAGVADVVARLLAYLAAIKAVASTQDFDAGSHTGLAPAGGQCVGLQFVAGVAALVDTYMAALCFLSPLVGRPVSQAVAQTGSVEVFLVGLESDQIHPFGLMDDPGRFRRQVKGIQRDFLATQLALIEKSEYGWTLAFLAAIVVGLSHHLPRVVGLGRDAGLAPLAARQYATPQLLAVKCEPALGFFAQNQAEPFEENTPEDLAVDLGKQQRKMGAGNNPLRPSLRGRSQGLEMVAHMSLQAGEFTVSATANG